MIDRYRIHYWIGYHWGNWSSFHWESPEAQIKCNFQFSLWRMKMGIYPTILTPQGRELPWALMPLPFWAALCMVLTSAEEALSRKTETLAVRHCLRAKTSSARGTVYSDCRWNQTAPMYSAERKIPGLLLQVLFLLQGLKPQLTFMICFFVTHSVFPLPTTGLVLTW